MFMSTECALLGAGCFWGVQELLRKIKGVLDTEVGYTGGAEAADAKYEKVKTGSTGHAESIQITFDADVLSFEKLVHYFFKLHDPTTLNQQGNDKGTQYRSAIFYSSPEQKEIAEKVKSEVEKSGQWKKPIVTEITASKGFYSAESYHQDYLQKNPGGYTCHYWRN